MPDAAFYRIKVKQGEDFLLDLDLRSSGIVIDTTGWVGVPSIQTLDGFNPYDDTGQLLTFAVSFPVKGTLRLAMPAVKNMQLLTKRYLYDVKFLDSLNAAAYYLDGDVIVGRSYTP